MSQEGHTSENIERQLSQHEIETEISEINSRKLSLVLRKQHLQGNLGALLHDYGIAAETLDGFKLAKEALETRMENPTLSEKLTEKFKSLFGKQGGASKADFLIERENTEQSINYREMGESLRDSVGNIAEHKDALRDLMGEDLSFRGNTTEGEDRSARESSLQKVSDEIEHVNAEILILEDEIVKKREEAHEAWKRENPEEWNKTQEQQAVAEEVTKKIALFREFLQTGPSFEEVLQIVNSFNGELQENRSSENYRLFSEARKQVYEKCFSKFSDGHLDQILNMPSDFYSIQHDIDFIERSAKESRHWHTPLVGDGFIDIYRFAENYSRAVVSNARNTSFLVAAIHGYNKHYAPNESPVREFASSLVRVASSLERGVINYDDLKRAFELPSQAYSESKNQMVQRESLISYFPELRTKLEENEGRIRGFSSQNQDELVQARDTAYRNKRAEYEREELEAIARKKKEHTQQEAEERLRAKQEELKRSLLS